MVACVAAPTHAHLQRLAIALLLLLATEIFEELFIISMFFLEVLHTLLAHNDALGWFEYLLLNDERGLPTLHPVLFASEIGRLWPHTIDMPKVVLQVRDHSILLLFLLSNVLDLLPVL